MSRETKITTSLNTVLHGLQPFTNYSVQVLGFTRAGEGPSATTYCTTEETVPDPPERIKSVVNGESSVIISWLPPRRPNGIVTKYTVYIRVLDKGQEVKIIKDNIAAQKHHFEVKDLNARETYESWITASTRIGQGQSTSFAFWIRFLVFSLNIFFAFLILIFLFDVGTPVIKLVPSNTVPAAIISFGQILSVAWKVEIKLACTFVGKPASKAEWKAFDSKR